MKIKSLFVLFFVFFSVSVFSEVLKTNAHASYYAEKYHGRRTASGEIFNMNDMTCAHKTLPFGTILRVTNLKNGKTVDVRVNDRGPFVKGREIDVSKAAAVKLDMIKTGTANVRIEVVGKNSSSAIAKSSSASTNSSNSAKTTKTNAVTVQKSDFYDVQVASFSSYENANKTAQDLLRNGFENVYFQKTSSVTRVVIKKIPNSQLRMTEAKLRANGFDNYIVKKNG